MKCDEDKQAPGRSTSTALVQTRYCRSYDHRIIGHANNQQDQDDHDFAQKLEKLTKLKDIAVHAVGHLDVLFVEQRRHARLAAEQRTQPTHMLFAGL